MLIGPRLADIRSLTENFLPKSAIDHTSYKLAEVIQKRLGTISDKLPKTKDIHGNE